VASLPPESQDWFRCQPAGQAGSQWSDQCVEAIKETAVGVIIEEIGKAEASRYQLGKLALKKFRLGGMAQQR
jgi:hypothetical protein